MNKLEHALAFAAKGLPIIRLHGVYESGGQMYDSKTGALATKDAGKQPIDRWQDAKTCDEVTIRGWFEADPNINYGVCMGGGWLVVDCDTEEASERFEEALELMVVDEDGMPVDLQCYVVKTARGKHYYFRGQTRNRVAVEEGLDIRGDGGYVVGPGCQSWTGAFYTELSGSLDAVDEIPAWMIRGQERGSDDHQHMGVDKPVTLGEGLRNDGLFQMMSAMVAHGIDKRIVEVTISEINRTQVDPPLSDDELRGSLFHTLWKDDFKYGASIQSLLALKEYEFTSQLYRELDQVIAGRQFMLKSDMLLMPKPVWLIQDRIPNRGVIQLHGRSYTGKTFVAIDMVMSMMNGVPWLGMEYRLDATPDGEVKDHVLYVLTEGLFDFRVRLDGWVAKKGGDYGKLITLAEKRYDLSRLDEWDRLWTAMQEDERVRNVAHRIGMVIIDTQSNAMDVNELDNNVMSKAAQVLREVSTRMQCPITLVHHDPYGDQGNRGDRIGGRGASSFGAAMDVVMALDPPGDGHDTLSLKFTKVKAAKLPPTPYSFMLVEQDVDGMITAVADDEGINERLQVGNDALVERVRQILADEDTHTLRWGQIYGTLGLNPQDPRVRTLRNELNAHPDFDVRRGQGRGNYYEVELRLPMV